MSPISAAMLAIGLVAAAAVEPFPPLAPVPALPVDAMAPAGSFPGSGEPCEPAIGEIRFDGEESPEIAARVEALFDGDQARDQGDWEAIDWETVGADDLARRSEIYPLLVQGKITQAGSLYHAAMIFQHGSCAEHFKLTADLAERAAGLGHEKAKWLHAAGLDRYLMNLGKPQKYGTQFAKTEDGVWRLYEVDPAVTDEERARFNVPPLAKAREVARSLNERP